MNGMSYKIENFYSSNLNYKGEDIKKRTYILILSIKLFNGTEDSRKINMPYMRNRYW